MTQAHTVCPPRYSKQIYLTPALRYGLAILLLLLSLTAQAAAPPPLWRWLTQAQGKEVVALQKKLDQHVEAGEYEAAAKVAQQIAEYRASLQGAVHHQVVDARFEVQELQRLSQVPASDRAEVQRAKKISNEGVDHFNRGRPREAEKPLREALAIHEKVLGPFHPSTASSYNNVAVCLEAQGKAKEALPLYQKALAIREKVLGSLHPDTAGSYNNVAYCLQSMGKVAEALLLYQKGMAIYEKVLGPLHPNTALSYNNVANCLQAHGKVSEALPLYQKALAIREKVLGPQHPSTARSYTNLAFCLHAQGKAVEALLLFQRAQVIFEKVLGPLHPLTANSYTNVAGCLEDQGKVEEALPLYQKALGTFEKVLGPLHPDTAGGYNNVASCLQAQGKIGEALPLYQQALAIREKVLGAQHPSTALSYNNLAACLYAQGKAGEALPLFQKALSIREKVLAPLHPDNAQSCNNLAHCLQNLGKAEEALPLFRKALAIFEKVLPPFHPNTATTCSSLAFCLQAQGKTGEALPLFQRALAIREKVLDPLHPDNGQSYNNLAFCLQAQGKTEAALPLYQKALSIREQVLGPYHPYTSQTCINLAGLMQGQGKWAEAAKAYQSATQGHEFGRLAASSSGFDRAQFEANKLSPRAGLAAMLVRLGQPAAAWEQAESDLGRGLLDDLLGLDQQQPQDRADLAELARLDAARLPLLGLQKRDEKQQRQLEVLNQQSRAVQKRLAERAVQRARQRVLSRAEVQRHIPEDAALVFWLDVRGEHLGCVVRHSGEPAWVRLPGSGKAGEWTARDDALPSNVYQELTTPGRSSDGRERLLPALRKQRLEPLEPHLQGVRRLLVVPAGELASLPIEAITDRYTISYIGSGSIHARVSAQSRPLQADKLLALGDPAFEIPKAKTPEPLPLALRGGKQWSRLPGTRLEVQLLQQLLPEATTLLGSAASEQNLQKLATSGELSRYRLLHLATHGEANATHPEETALILSQDALPDNAARVLEGKRPIEGRLTVGTVLREWKLDADLVVLSACQTGLGQQAAGEGMLGFAQALMQRGARSVVLSRWKVDDGATALLMQRFYQNVLGKRPGLKGPLGRAEALKEAKDWLRTLSGKEAGRLLAEINAKVERGPGAKPLAAVQVPREAAKEARPYEHPFYWAAFVLLGDWR